MVTSIIQVVVNYPKLPKDDQIQALLYCFDESNQYKVLR